MLKKLLLFAACSCINLAAMDKKIESLKASIEKLENFRQIDPVAELLEIQQAILMATEDRSGKAYLNVDAQFFNTSPDFNFVCSVFVPWLIEQGMNANSLSLVGALSMCSAENKHRAIFYHCLIADSEANHFNVDCFSW